MTSDDMHTLGRERIPGWPDEGGRTILSAIGDLSTHPVLCPRCARTAEPGDRPAYLDVDDPGDAYCPRCALTLPGILDAVEPYSWREHRV